MTWFFYQREGRVSKCKLWIFHVERELIKLSHECLRYRLANGSALWKVSLLSVGFYCHWINSGEYRMWPGALVWISTFPCSRECLNQWLWPHVSEQNWPQKSAQIPLVPTSYSGMANLLLLQSKSDCRRNFPQKAGKTEKKASRDLVFSLRWECCHLSRTVLHTHLP